MDVIYLTRWKGQGKKLNGLAFSHGKKSRDQK